MSEVAIRESKSKGETLPKNGRLPGFRAVQRRFFRGLSLTLVFGSILGLEAASPSLSTTSAPSRVPSPVPGGGGDGKDARASKEGTDSSAQNFNASFKAIDAAAILRGVRESQGSIRQTLQGRLRAGPRKLPYRMTMDGAELRFEFPEARPPDPQVVSLRFGEKDASVQAQTGEGTLKKVQFEDEIAGMGVLYEDLAMRYLYWKDAEVVGEERMLAPLYVKCWKILVRRPLKTRSTYREVLVWISQENGGILKSESFDDGGELVRRLKVVSIQGSEQGTTLKQMRIESPKSGGNYVYLDVDGRAAPRISK